MKIDKGLSFLDMIPIGPYLVSFESLEAMLYAQEFNSQKNLEWMDGLHLLESLISLSCTFRITYINGRTDPANNGLVGDQQLS